MQRLFSCFRHFQSRLFYFVTFITHFSSVDRLHTHTTSIIPLHTRPPVPFFYWVLLCPNSDISLYLWGCCVNVRTFPCSYQTLSVLYFPQSAFVPLRNSPCLSQSLCSRIPCRNRQLKMMHSRRGCQVSCRPLWRSS